MGYCLQDNSFIFFNRPMAYDKTKTDTTKTRREGSALGCYIKDTEPLNGMGDPPLDTESHELTLKRYF